jgi:hypothetical protein
VEAEKSASMRGFVMVMGRCGENMDAGRRRFGEAMKTDQKSRD